MKITRQQAEHDAQLLKELTEVVPEGLRSFVRNEAMIENLVKYGQTEFRFDLRRGNGYPPTRGPLKTLLEELREKWGGCVSYTFSDEHENGAKLYFKSVSS